MIVQPGMMRVAVVMGLYASSWFAEKYCALSTPDSPGPAARVQ